MSVDLRVFRDLQALSAAAAAEIAETIKVAAPLKRALAPDTPDRKSLPPEYSAPHARSSVGQMKRQFDRSCRGGEPV